MSISSLSFFKLFIELEIVLSETDFELFQILSSLIFLGNHFYCPPIADTMTEKQTFSIKRAYCNALL